MKGNSKIRISHPTPPPGSQLKNPNLIHFGSGSANSQYIEHIKSKFIYFDIYFCFVLRART
jgi:hypothetical protein